MNLRFFEQLCPIEDLYFVSEEIRKVNENFKLFYNIKTKRYEIREGFEGNKFIISIESYPDEKLLEKLAFSDPQNIDKVFKKVEEENAKLLEKERTQLLESSFDCFKEIENFSTKTTHELERDVVKKIIEKDK